jgi:hypothetical protein
MNLGDRRFSRSQLRQGGGRGNGNDHLEDLLGSSELYIYRPPGGRMKGFDGLKLFAESESCEIIFTMDAPPELKDYETIKITNSNTKTIPDHVVKRGHSWAHRNNFLHSFFKPLYR